MGSLILCKLFVGMVLVWCGAVACCSGVCCCIVGSFFGVSLIWLGCLCLGCFALASWLVCWVWSEALLCSPGLGRLSLSSLSEWLAGLLGLGFGWVLLLLLLVSAFDVSELGFFWFGLLFGFLLPLASGLCLVGLLLLLGMLLLGWFAAVCVAAS